MIYIKSSSFYRTCGSPWVKYVSNLHMLCAQTDASMRFLKLYLNLQVKCINKGCSLRHYWYFYPHPNVAKVPFHWGPCRHLLLVTKLQPLSSPLIFMDGNPTPSHSFLNFILIFFLSLCSTPLLSFSLYVFISPTPLLCHQLAPSVSMSWSHCACPFCFLITHLYACMSRNMFHKLKLDMHIYIVTINPWFPLIVI